MGKWLYTIKKGIELREQIKRAKTDKDRANVLLRIRECCKEVIDRFNKDEDILYSFEELYYLTEGDDDIILNQECREYGFDDAVDLVNNRLAELYDICDKHHIFVALI